MSDNHSLRRPVLLRACILSLLILFILFLIAVPSTAAQEPDGIRIESEAKLKVPLEQADDVWAWLQTRYTDASWLARDGYEFRAAFGDEDFTDTYFDTADLVMLGQQSGVRYRVREVNSGPAIAKDDRQLLQLKLNRDDPTGLARSEIKFNAGPLELRPKSDDDVHPMIGLVQRNERQEMKAAFQSLGLDPYAMRPILTLQQNRKRVYIDDQFGAFATLTLDLCSTTSWGADLRWAEIELELNEIRYTVADEATRLWMESTILAIQNDLQQAFPRIEQDQTPKYNTTFNRIEAETWLPLPQVIKLGLTLDDIVAIEATVALGMLGLLLFTAGRLWRRLQSGRPEPEPATPLGDSV